MTTNPFLNAAALGQFASAGAVRSARVAGVVQDGYRRWLSGLTSSAGQTARLVGELGKCRTQADLVALQREMIDSASARLADDIRAFIELSNKLVAEVTAPVGPAAVPAESAAPAPAPAPVKATPAPAAVEAAPVVVPAPVVAEAVPEPAPAPVTEEAPAPAVVEEAPAPVVEAAPEPEPVAESAPEPAAPPPADAVAAVAAALDAAPVPVVEAPAAVAARPPRAKGPRGGRPNPRSKPASAH
ncbi:hypothetical protein M2352_001336 [Azospirillum fermentarium]|uniref:hypothetical protein n=1 Tax=Azospirillum fermentarium TaxID=1233114 RepID=UPI0022265622|nr:hypothetical protein [Azospirillum fermentarium]MCW2245745.1 hypothetical protein [Azospirillum fermentarium]